MIWHIFRKDWRLHWRFAALLAVAQFVYAAVLVKLGPFADNRGLMSLLPLLVLLTLVGIPFLLAAVVHSDAIPGERQDWLVRPINRKHLLAAKFLFLLLAVHVPLFAADLSRGLANGFGFGESMGAASSHGLFVLLCFSVPAFAFVSLTRNFMEAIVAGLLIFVTLVGFLFLVDQTTSRAMLVQATGLSWIPSTMQIVTALIGAAIVLCAQYFRRTTTASRGIAAATVLASAAVIFLPWSTGFALERKLGSDPSGGSAIEVSFDASPAPAVEGVPPSAYEGFANLHFPIKFDHIPSDGVVYTDRSEVSFRAANGVSSRLVPTLLGALQGNHGDGRYRAGTLVPAGIYQRLKDDTGNIEIRVWMTLFRHDDSYSIPAIQGHARLGEMGWCQTDINAPETAVRLGCVSLKDEPSCLTVELRHIPSGRSNGAFLHCEGEYAPYSDELFSLPVPPLNLDFRDISGRVTYKVEGPQLGESRVFVETYKPVDHFARTIVIPSTRLRDWLQQ